MKLLDEKKTLEDQIAKLNEIKNESNKTQNVVQNDETKKKPEKVEFESKNIQISKLESDKNSLNAEIQSKNT